jgi:hypothetical protein
MRPTRLALCLLSAALAGSPAFAQSWSGSLPAAQNQSSMLTFEVPALADLIGWNLYLAYSPAAFETPTFELSIALGDLDQAGQMAPTAPQAANFGQAVPSGHLQVVGFGTLVEAQSVAGSLLKVTFVAKPTAIGSTDVFSRFEYALDSEFDGSSNLSPLNTTIAAVPEPRAWALLLAGMALVGGAAVRRRGGR